MGSRRVRVRWLDIKDCRERRGRYDGEYDHRTKHRTGNWYIGGYGSGSTSDRLSYIQRFTNRSPTELGPIFFADKAMTYNEVWEELKKQEMYN